jgi:hypothetical protein
MVVLFSHFPSFFAVQDPVGKQVNHESAADLPSQGTLGLLSERRRQVTIQSLFCKWLLREGRGGREQRGIRHKVQEPLLMVQYAGGEREVVQAGPIEELSDGNDDCYGSSRFFLGRLK